MNNCPKCGSSVEQGEAFCRVCGTKLPVPETNFSNDTQQFQQVNQPEQTQMNNQTMNYQQSITNQSFQGFQQSQNDIMNDDVLNDILIDAYIGKNADRLKNEGFSWNTLFLGNFYVFYRKMWLLGFIWLICSFVALLFSNVNSIISYGINLVVWIFISIQFKKLYLKHVKKQVEKIKTKNPGKTKEQLIMRCSQKGGTSFWIPVVVLFILCFIGFCVGFAVGIMERSYYEKYTSTINNPSGVIGDLYVKIPSNFTNIYSSDRVKSFTLFSGSDHCTLYLNAAYGGTYNYDVKQYLEKMATKLESSEISKKTINNNSWYYGQGYGSYFYSTLHNGVIYMVEIDMYEGCSSEYNTIISSLKFN
jgi:hypothetical protein